MGKPFAPPEGMNINKVVIGNGSSETVIMDISSGTAQNLPSSIWEGSNTNCVVKKDLNGNAVYFYDNSGRRVAGDCMYDHYLKQSTTQPQQGTPDWVLTIVTKQ